LAYLVQDPLEEEAYPEAFHQPWHWDPLAFPVKDPLEEVALASSQDPLEELREA